MRVLAICVISFAAAHLLGQGANYGFGEEQIHRWHLGLLVDKFDLDLENNVPTWYQSSALLLCACLLGVVAHRGGLHSGRRWVWHWRGLAAIFVYLSVDETGSLHEPVGQILRSRFGFSGFLFYAWVVPAICVLTVLGAAYLNFVRGLPARERTRFLLAAAVYVGGAVGIEMIGGNYAQRFGEEHFAYALLTGLEETMEMTGVLLFARALMQYIEERVTGPAVVQSIPAATAR